MAGRKRKCARNRMCVRRDLTAVASTLSWRFHCFATPKECIRRAGAFDPAAGTATQRACDELTRWVSGCVWLLLKGPLVCDSHIPMP